MSSLLVGGRYSGSSSGDNTSGVEKKDTKDFTQTAVITTAYTANSGDSVWDEILCDVRTGIVTITLPGSPLLGEKLRIVDIHSNSSSFNIIVERNGNLIKGFAEDYGIRINGQTVELTWTGTEVGWVS